MLEGSNLITRNAPETETFQLLKRDREGSGTKCSTEIKKRKKHPLLSICLSGISNPSISHLRTAPPKKNSIFKINPIKLFSSHLSLKFQLAMKNRRPHEKRDNHLGMKMEYDKK